MAYKKKQKQVEQDITQIETKITQVDDEITQLKNEIDKVESEIIEVESTLPTYIVLSTFDFYVLNKYISGKQGQTIELADKYAAQLTKYIEKVN